MKIIHKFSVVMQKNTLFLPADMCLPYVRRGTALSLDIKVVSAGAPIGAKAAFAATVDSLNRVK